MSSSPPKRKRTAARTRDPEATRSRLIEAAVRLILQQGYAATKVDQICKEAGLTKGSFFHHFAGKEEIAEAAIEWWARFGASLYAEAWADDSLDPLEQLGRFFDIMADFTRREDEVTTCVVGMLSQEIALSHESLREAAARELGDWTENTARILEKAKTRHCPGTSWDPEDLAWYLNSVWQGSMLVGKTRRDPALVRRNLAYAREWVAGHFPEESRKLLSE